MAIRVEVVQVVEGMWVATVRDKTRIVEAVSDVGEAHALENAVRVWRIATTLQRANRRKLN